MFAFETTVKLHDTDAAGLLFFAHQFKIVHDCYEACLASGGVSFHTILTERDYLLPIVHAEADYPRPLHVDQPIIVELTVGRLGTTSFVLKYRIRDDKGETVGTASTVHVCMDASSRAKRPLPDELRSLFGEHLES
jgi:YbgC/YbaW family acyl-CoA thioester hydrolase